MGMIDKGVASSMPESLKRSIGSSSLVKKQDKSKTLKSICLVSNYYNLQSVYFELN